MPPGVKELSVVDLLWILFGLLICFGFIVGLPMLLRKLPEGPTQREKRARRDQRARDQFDDDDDDDPPGPPRAPAAAQLADEVPIATPLHQRPIEDRRHTVAAAPTGGGKTTTLNTLLVHDLRRGVQAIVCSPQFTPFHPKNQTIDLRPILDYFEIATEASEIEAAIAAVVAQIEPRLALHRAGRDVGHPIALYLGEWEQIQRMCDEAILDQVVRIIDQGRILNLWIGFMEVHAGLVSRLGGDGGFRSAFRTRLAGDDLDQVSWRVFVGKQIKQQRVPFGHWMTSEGLTAVVRPSSLVIAEIAKRGRSWPRLLQRSFIEMPARQPAGRQLAGANADDLDEVRGPVRADERGSEDRTALERGEPRTDEAREPFVSVLEMLFIARELGKGTAPSRIAKAMPGYRGDRYALYIAKVEHVIALAAEEAAQVKS